MLCVHTLLRTRVTQGKVCCFRWAPPPSGTSVASPSPLPWPAVPPTCAHPQAQPPSSWKSHPTHIPQRSLVPPGSLSWPLRPMQSRPGVWAPRSPALLTSPSGFRPFCWASAPLQRHPHSAPVCPRSTHSIPQGASLKPCLLPCCRNCHRLIGSCTLCLSCGCSNK